MTIKDLQPKIVWDNFYGITRQPRPSKHEEKIRAWLLDWAKQRGIEAFADETGNVIMRKPATPGMENLKGVIMQGHMDMVPQKNADVKHDFEKDPIETWVDGDWLKAKGTTLGADNGLGVALALSVLESDDIKHGPLELLVTYDEETKLYTRYQYGGVHIDYNTNEPLTFNNIIIQIVQESNRDKNGYQDIEGYGDRDGHHDPVEGKGYYICEGKCIEITWAKNEAAYTMNYYTLDGEKLKLRPGKTFIALFPHYRADKIEIE